MKKEGPKRTKKSQILSFYREGTRDVGELATITRTRPSYVAEVLREGHNFSGYFDLYTTTEEPMNIYSHLFARRLGFRTENIAKRSVSYINRLYKRFVYLNDTPGQHHALMMGLLMFNRARSSGKLKEAATFRDWLAEKLSEFEVPRE